MSTLCLVSQRHFMVNRRLVIYGNGEVTCYRASACCHSFEWKYTCHGNAFTRLIVAVRWLVGSVR